jgi:hypothetical protein
MDKRMNAIKNFFIKIWSYRWVEESRIPKEGKVWDDGGYGWVTPGWARVDGYEITEVQPGTGLKRTYWISKDGEGLGREAL